MISLVENEATWVVDSGVVSHATPYRDFFISYTPGDFRRVKMGNGLTSKIIGNLDDEGFCNTFNNEKWRFSRVPKRFGLVEVSYDNLYVFWGKSFMHIPKDERPKLKSKSRQCVFLGYGLDNFGYKIYDPIEKEVIRSRDVDFMEDQTIKDIDKVKKSDAKFNNEHDIPFQVYEQNDSHNEQDAPIQFDDQDNQNDGHEIPMHDYEQNDQPNVLND
nr:retrovirus-related Pol polyprotein from transposon TNT 1-94 [Tanacetum cinerariifolium]